jgi:hypothetical protein
MDIGNGAPHISVLPVINGDDGTIPALPPRSSSNLAAPASLRTAPARTICFDNVLERRVETLRNLIAFFG